MCGDTLLEDSLLIPRPLTTPNVHETIRKVLPDYLAPRSRVVDLGAGQGAFTAWLQERGHSVLPIDGTGERWKLPEVPLLLTDLNGRFSERIPETGFDACIALELIEHLENPFEFLRECRAVLREGGILVVSSPNVEAMPSRMIYLWNGRLRFFSPDETQGHHLVPLFAWQFEYGLRRAGFEVDWIGFNRIDWDCGRSLKSRLMSLVARVLAPALKGDRYGEIRLIIARAEGA
jgi:SAM-dependent methyltransferase